MDDNWGIKSKRSTQNVREQIMVHQLPVVQIESLEDGYYEVNLAGYFTYANAAFIKILGTTQRRIIDSSYVDYVDEADISTISATFNKVFRTGRGVKSFNVTMREKNGKWRTLEISVSLLKSPEAEPTGFFGVARDITAHKTHEIERENKLKEMQALYEQLSELEEMKTFMLRLASHELRSPMTLIAGYTDLLYEQLQQHFTDEEQLYYHYIQKAIENLINVTNNILVLERMHSSNNELPIPRNIVYLEDLGHKVVMDHNGEAHLKDIKLIGDIPLQSMRVYGDEIEISRAMSNLVGNAIKYTPKGGTVTIKLSGDDTNALFEVIDTGYGIPADKIDSVFQAFTRISTTETKKIEGSGLGLYLVKKIIEWHHGSVDVKSVYKKGSTFSFSLPLAPPDTP